MGLAFSNFSPSRALHPLVAGYWVLEDLAGHYRGNPIRTIPTLGATLTVNVGLPNRRIQDLSAPKVSLLGLQTRTTAWISDVNTRFVMAVLRPMGIVTLFAHDGSLLADEFIDVGSLAGDAWVLELAADVSARENPAAMARAMDSALLRRLENTKPQPTHDTLRAAIYLLAAGGRVEEVADQLDLSRRHLARLFTSRMGVNPKTFASIARIQSSVSAFQSGVGDPYAGFSDQSHQIREWKCRMAVTPTKYRKEGLSPMARYFGRSTDTGVTFFL